MPRPLASPLGKRQPRALVIGLRRILKDPRATVAQRLEACRLLALIAGYIETTSTASNGASGSAQAARIAMVQSPTNGNRLRELLEITREEDAAKGLPGVPISIPSR